MDIQKDLVKNEAIYIEYGLKEIGEKIVDIELRPEFNGKTQLIVNNTEKDLHGGTKLKCNTIINNGLCIIDNKILVGKDMTFTCKILGPHVGLNFLFDSNADANEPSPESAIMTGRIHTSFEQTVEYTLPYKKMHSNYMVSIIMSRQYYLELFKSETLSHNFSLFKHVQNNVPFRSGPHDLQINMTIKQMLNKITSNPYIGLLKRHFVDSKIKGVVSLMHEQELGHEPAIQIQMDNGELDKLYKARDILHTNLQNPPTIRGLSRMVLLNELKLKQGFKSLFGVTIHNYLIKLRMETAYTMMNEQNVLIFEVALQLGYKDTSHFINIFKKYYGYTPKFFCKNIRSALKVMLPIVYATQYVLDFLKNNKTVFTSWLELAAC